MRKLLFFLAVFLLLSYAAFRIFFYIDHRSEEKQVAENEHSLRLTPSQLDSLQEGDIILRRGYGIFSDMIAKRLNDGRFDVTHSGILYRKNGNLVGNSLPLFRCKQHRWYAGTALKHFS